MVLSIKLSILFVLLWIIVLIIYPSWLLIPQFSLRFFIFIVFILISLTSYLGIKKWFDYEINIKKPEFSKHTIILSILSFIYLILQIKFLGLPLTTGDEGYHISRGIWLIQPLADFFGFNFIRVIALILLGLITGFYLLNKRLSKIKNYNYYLYFLILIISLTYFFIVNKIAMSYSSVYYKKILL